MADLQFKEPGPRTVDPATSQPSPSGVANTSLLDNGEYAPPDDDPFSDNESVSLAYF